jgi:hypothetical protein
MSVFALTQHQTPQPSGLSCSYYLVDPLQVNHRTVLVVSYGGIYPDGSRGNAHGRFIAVSAVHGLHAFDADCVILDLRDLSYQWGNTLLQVFQDISQFKDCGGEPREPTFPVAVVTSEKCQVAFLSLVTPTGKSAPAWHFDNFDEAIRYATAKIEEWYAF